MGRAKAKQNLSGESPWTATADSPQTCALCARAGLPLTRHHLVPRATHRRTRVRRLHRDRNVKTETVPLCRPCHRTVHATFSERELAERFSTLEALRAHPAIERFARFAARQAPERRLAVRPPA